MLALSIAGCSQYLDRRETVLLGAGEAVQANIVTHQIDPWPAYARNVHTETSGARLEQVIQRYRNPQMPSSAVTAPGTPGLGGTAPTNR